MNAEEARKVAAIALAADGYCYICAGKLIEMLKAAFPELAEVFAEVFARRDEY